MDILTSNSFDPDKDVPDLSGKVFIVTGGSAGIGYGIVYHLLQHNPSKIYILSNKEEHASSTIETLEKEFPIAKSVLIWKQCNLLSLKQTLAVAQELKSELTQLDALILNAGLGVGSYNLSEDGIDSHFQVNHLSQFLIAMILLPVLRQTPNSRLIAQSSSMHRLAKSETKFASLDEINTDIGPTSLYSRTKLAQILFVRRLTRLLQESRDTSFAGKGAIYVIATHPGAIATDQPKQAEEAYGLFGKVVVGAAKNLIMKDPVDEGCKSALWAATSGEVVEANITGVFVVPDKKIEEPSAMARDEALGDKLWEFSEEVLREKLGGKLPYDGIEVAPRVPPGPAGEESEG